MVARSSVDGKLYPWTALTAMRTGVGFKGPGTPLDVAVTGRIVNVPPVINPLELHEVTTRGGLPNARTNYTLPISSINPFFIRSDGSALRVMWTNVGILSGVKTTSGGTVTFHKAEFEYPIGTFTPITFNGGSPTLTTGAEITVSDPLAITVSKGNPRGNIWTARTHSVAMFHGSSSPYMNPVLGESVALNTNYAVSGRGFAGTIAGEYWLGPARIMGMTRDRNDICSIADSLSYGAGETQATQDATGDCGTIARAFGSNYSYFRLGGPGMSAEQFTGDVAAHMLAVYNYAPASWNIVGMGTNDRRILGRTALQIEASVSAIPGQFPVGTKFALATIPPDADTTDGYTTLIGQTPLDGGVFDAFNAWARAVPAGFALGCKDFASFLEQGTTGKWQVTGSPGIAAYASDAVHPTALGNERLRNRFSFP